jgi:hypothetical protein
MIKAWTTTRLALMIMIAAPNQITTAVIASPPRLAVKHLQSPQISACDFSSLHLSKASLILDH